MGFGLSKRSQLKTLESRFDAKELYTLRQTFLELASGNRGRFIDRQTFARVFRMPGVLPDSLFNAFDVNHCGMIDYDAFITGLALFVRGSSDERIDFIFRIYDIDRNGRITREGLTTVLNSVLFAGYLVVSSQFDPERISDSISDVISNTTKKLVDDAFRYQQKEALTKDQFRRWAQDNAIEVAFALDVLIRGRNALGPRSFNSRRSSFLDIGRPTFDGILRSPSRSQSDSPIGGLAQSPSRDSSFSSGDSSDSRRSQACPPDLSEFSDKMGIQVVCRSCDYGTSACYCAYCGMALQSHERIFSCKQCISESRSVSCLFCVNCGTDLRYLLKDEDECEPIFGETLEDDTYCPMQGPLLRLKKQLSFSILSERWCRLTGNFLYKYRNEKSSKPSRMICLEDAHIERVDHSQINSRMKFGVQIYSPINQLKHVYYAETEEDREKWFKCLRKAARQFCFEDFYTTHGKIGEGKFANVFSCTSKKNNRDYAVKIIYKYDIRACDREGLRTEIAVLHLVHHPSIVHLKNIFETHTAMYIVMSLVEGGDLFQRLEEHGPYCVDDAGKVMVQLLRALQYLHERGIVHRDLKPENIMLTTKESLTSIQLVDFGLSKFIAPEEKMDQTCGTFCYLAPEVLLRRGYDKDVREYLDKTMSSEFSLDGDDWDIVPGDVKSLIRRMLNPSPKLRITVKEALLEPWLVEIALPVTPSEATSSALQPVAGYFSMYWDDSCGSSTVIHQLEMHTGTCVQL